MFAKQILKVVPHAANRGLALSRAASLHLSLPTIRADKASAWKVARQTAERYTRMTGCQWIVTGGLR